MEAKSECKDPSISPFLAKTAQLRTGSDQIPGYYSDEQDLWVVETEQGVKPIITNGVLAQLVTKTKVQIETDDESPFASNLKTKTEQMIERDDDVPYNTSQILQLVTKTDSVSEKDDTFDDGQLAQLTINFPKTPL